MMNIESFKLFSILSLPVMMMHMKKSEIHIYANELLICIFFSIKKSVGVAGEIFTHIADSYSSYAGEEETTKSKQIRDTVSNTGSSVSIDRRFVRFLWQK